MNGEYKETYPQYILFYPNKKAPKLSLSKGAILFSGSSISQFSGRFQT